MNTIPFKDKKKQKSYMKSYMRQYRALERKLIREARMKLPNIDKQIRKELGFKKKKRGKKC